MQASSNRTILRTEARSSRRYTPHRSCPSYPVGLPERRSIRDYQLGSWSAALAVSELGETSQQFSWPVVGVLRA